MNKTIRVNGDDFTNVFTPTGYTVSYIKRRGNNSGPMLDGGYTDDVLAVKAVVTCICMPTDESTLQNLLNKIANTYVRLYYYDPRAGYYKEIDAMPSEPSQKYRGENCNLLQYWTGTVITFTEK